MRARRHLGATTGPGPDMRHLPLLLTLALACAPLVSARCTATTAPATPVAPLCDCNGNGIEDAFDIANGSSSDLDCDGVPDECAL